MKKFVQILTLVILSGGWELSRAQTADLLLPADVSKDVRVTVTVAKRARLEISNPVGIYTVTPEDRRRGYLDVPGALVAKLWCNSREGAVIRGRLETLYFENPFTEPSVKLMYRLAGQGSYRDAGDGWQGLYENQNISRGTPVAIDLRFKLGPAAPTGDYSFAAYLEAEPK